MPSLRVPNDVVADSADLANKHTLRCPRRGCDSLILRPGTARLVNLDGATSADLTEIPAHLLQEPQTESRDDSYRDGYWKVDNMMDFENVGFLKTLEGSGIKYLSCADCDLAPLGFHDTRDQGPSRGFFMAVQRVRYT
ncbi:hypothetical protein IWQ60_009363 [Tieghemiomyces parasiticus]|uniref:Mss4-like protein n=1 Tax=Tieghemiomyces parasiticus TaxID=78921 RepID=A0A9W7ZXY4_9FUNG|nr:hypothetical protein IWQ60_009363 [Tieghemiomyces parasiticus]